MNVLLTLSELCNSEVKILLSQRNNIFTVPGVVLILYLTFKRLLCWTEYFGLCLATHLSGLEKANGAC